MGGVHRVLALKLLRCGSSKHVHVERETTRAGGRSRSRGAGTGYRLCISYRLSTGDGSKTNRTWSALVLDNRSGRSLHTRSSLMQGGMRMWRRRLRRRHVRSRRRFHFRSRFIGPPWVCISMNARVPSELVRPRETLVAAGESAGVGFLAGVGSDVAGLMLEAVECLITHRTFVGTRQLLRGVCARSRRSSRGCCLRWQGLGLRELGHVLYGEHLRSRVDVVDGVRKSCRRAGLAHLNEERKRRSRRRGKAGAGWVVGFMAEAE